jgi:plasmid stabilization system protein ParE
MEYRVEIQPQAQADLDAIFEWVAARAPYRGPLWFERLESAIWSLQTYPERYPADAKLRYQGVTVRKLAFGRRPNEIRIYYAITGDAVHVIHVRHGRRGEPSRL